MTGWTHGATLLGVNPIPPDPMTLDQVMGRPRRGRAPLIVGLVALAVILVAAVVIAVLAGGRHPSRPVAAASPAASSSARAPIDADTLAVDAGTQQVCDLNQEIDADTTGTVMDHGDLIQEIGGRAVQAGEPDVRDHANALADQYSRAVAARGGPHELAESVRTLTRHIELTTACLAAGWRSS